MEILLVSLILLVGVALLVSERLPMDLTALGIMVALMVTGLLTPTESVAGFAHPAPLTVAALFIVSQGLLRTGALDFLTKRIAILSGGRPRAILLLMLLLAGVFSAFINNTPVVVLAIPVIVALGAQHHHSPSKFLMPVSFISILAGTTTMIGTSTNIVVSELGGQFGLAPLGMFELSRVGLPLALVGLVFLYFFSFRLLPSHRQPVLESHPDERRHYLSELLIPAESPLLGLEPTLAMADRYAGIEVFEVLRGMHVYDPATDPVTLREGDILLVRGGAVDLAQALNDRVAVLPSIDGHAMDEPFRAGALILELIVLPTSRWIGRRLMNTALGRDKDIWMIGVKRQRAHYGRRDIRSLRLSVGDVLLVQGPSTSLSRLRAERGIMVVEDVVRSVVHRARAPLALTLFLAMVAAASLGIANILVCAMAAAFVMIVTGCMTLRDAYEALDVRVLLLIIGTIALGTALQRTGAAEVYARGFLALFDGRDPRVVLGGLIVLTSLLSHFLSNNSTAVLLLPVAVSTAAVLGVEARPFMIGVCIGASACFATPIGYQTNLLVFAPGGYRFTDFLKLGMPLNVLVWVGGTLLIPVFWPF